MRHIFFTFLTAIMLLAPGSLVLAQAETPTPAVESPTGVPAEIAIQSPLPGQALQGNVSIAGTTAIAGFRSAELDFAYAGNPLDTWFLVAQSQAPITNAELAQWDTTTITDGTYSLRLTVTLEDGSQQSVTVSGLRVRNYTPIETDTPAPTATPVPGDTPVPTITPTPTITPVPPTITPLPPNPDQLSTRNVFDSAGKGALAVLAFFAFIGIYRSIRSFTSRS